ncbi:MAG: histidine phosphatase family protein [Ruminococcaceae bacterium]|nr:histidine phosphatase family protein [Oscillospiraceae bacterium]
MLFFYIRHGDPIYDPDSLTPMGHLQAAAVAKRLAQHGIDRIYASTSNRAMLTAQPTCELTHKEMTTLDFANEGHVWREFTVPRAEGGVTWAFYDHEYRALFASPEVRALGDRWYDHPKLVQFKAGMLRVYDEVDAYFASLGYEHERYTGCYRVTKHSDERVALFAHQGFSMAFMSALLDIPYPQYCLHYDMGHSDFTAINFVEHDGWAIPKVMTMSNDSHLYREGLPTLYNGEARF